MIALAGVAGARGGLVVGTDHAAEAVTGFYTKYGDGACDLTPLSGLTKRRVRAIGSRLGASDELTGKVPTADLESEIKRLKLAVDKIATKEPVELNPRLNVATAPREVIAGLKGFGLEDADVDAIMTARGDLTQADLGNTAAWLVSSAGLSPQKFRAIERYVTAASMIYRVQVVGYVSGGGPMARVEAVIDTNLGSPRILYFRDLGDLDNPRGFPHPDRQPGQTGQ